MLVTVLMYSLLVYFVAFFFFSFACRAVAQYLKSQSPEDLSSDLSLNKILEGKRRKLCARMFFETLVIFSTFFLLGYCFE